MTKLFFLLTTQQKSVDDENAMTTSAGGLDLTTAEEGAAASGVMSIDALQSFGVSATDLKALFYTTPKAFPLSRRKNLARPTISI